MDLKVQARAAEHILHLVTKKPFEPMAEFVPSKKPYTVMKSEKIPICSPESVGVSSAVIKSFLEEIQEADDCNIHQVLISRKGKLICSGAMAPYKMDLWHVSHSMCKTVTGIAIGILVTENKISLEDRLIDIFDKETPTLAKLRLNKLNVKHFLTMSTGLLLNESVIPAEKDWLKCVLDSGCRYDPGSEFAYNSINSYVLSCMVQKITGMTMFEFLTEKLFQPLGINNIHWESCPMGRTKGGWGMYILPVDMLKLGVFLLNKGKIGDKQIVSSDYIEDMTSKHMDTPESESSYGYGYQMWMGKRQGSFVFNGMLGQNIHCMPDLDMVIVVTGGNNKLFGNCHVNDIINKYFVDDFNPVENMPENSKALRDLRLVEYNLKSSAYPQPESKSSIKELISKTINRQQSIPKEMSQYINNTYIIEKSFVRLMPIFTQLMNNSYSMGINEISFKLINGVLYLEISEGEIKTKIPLSFDKYIESKITVNEEEYIVSSYAEMKKDEDDNPVLKISLPFLEHSNGRIMKIFFLKNKNIKIEWREVPGKEILSAAFDMFMTGMSETVVKEIKNRVDMDLIIDLAESIMEPTIYGSLK